MKLTITDAAFEKLNESRAGGEYLVLFYDTDGCGCGVNGTAALRWKEAKEKRDIIVECERLPVLVDRQQAVFFEEELKLDFVQHLFRLSSSAGILNPFISPPGQRQVH